MEPVVVTWALALVAVATSRASPSASHPLRTSSPRNLVDRCITLLSSSKKLREFERLFSSAIRARAMPEANRQTAPHDKESLFVRTPLFRRCYEKSRKSEQSEQIY